MVHMRTHNIAFGTRIGPYSFDKAAGAACKAMFDNPKGNQVCVTEDKTIDGDKKYFVSAGKEFKEDTDQAYLYPDKTAAWGIKFIKQKSIRFNHKNFGYFTKIIPYKAPAATE